MSREYGNLKARILKTLRWESESEHKGAC